MVAYFLTALSPYLPSPIQRKRLIWLFKFRDSDCTQLLVGIDTGCIITGYSYKVRSSDSRISYCHFLFLYCVAELVSKVRDSSPILVAFLWLSFCVWVGEWTPVSFCFMPADLNCGGLRVKEMFRMFLLDLKSKLGASIYHLTKAICCIRIQQPTKWYFFIPVLFWPLGILLNNPVGGILGCNVG